MSLRPIILLALLGLPYGYLAIYWISCFVSQCQFDGHIIFYTLIALLALPFLMLIIGGVLALGGARRVVAVGVSGIAKPGAAVAGTLGGVRFWIGLSLMIAAIPACVALLYLALDTPEPGRDRLGRICEKNGGMTVCRPDPDADHPSELDLLNRELRRQRDADRR
jgi:hypothetical protein